MIVFTPRLSSSLGKIRGRLAPSPTGFLHLGNAWAFWVAWLSARSARGELVLRIEDIDAARSKEEYVTALMEDLAWLGMDWDYGPGSKEGTKKGTKKSGDDLFRQSARFPVYEDALRFLEKKGLVYPCYCSRKELRDMAGAPHMSDAGAPYPGTCRSLQPEERERLEIMGRNASLRLCCPSEPVWSFNDLVMGRQEATLASCGGDFALRRSDGVFAYQLAVVADDMAMGVTEVVRGRDILASTPRQMYLYSLFGGEAPRYAHLPLVVDEAGMRLAKRHSSLTLRSLREAGVRPETILGWLAFASGLRPGFAPLYAGEIVDGFAFEKLSAATLRLPPDVAAHFIALQNR